MAVMKSLQEYRAVQQRRIAKLKDGKRRGPITAAKFMVAQCRRLAPRSSGRIMASIRRSGSIVSVGGTNPVTGFPYIHWVNATPGTGLDRVRLVYPFGDGKKYSYAQVARTGTPGFFWIAEERTHTFFRESMLRATRSALMAEY